MKRILILITSLALCVSSFAGDRVRQGDSAYVKPGFIVADSKADFEIALRYLLHDNQGALRGMVKTGRAIITNDYLMVNVEGEDWGIDRVSLPNGTGPLFVDAESLVTEKP